MTEPISVVVITRDRRESLLRTIDELVRLPERPSIIVVDNGSSDGSAQAVRARHPTVSVIESERNLGAAGRNVGVQYARSRYVAFSDDDSWWAPGSLTRAIDTLDRYPGIGLLAGRVLVGSESHEDPLNEMLAKSLPAPAGAPGRSIVGFLACAAVVRRDAFMAAGGFHPRFGVGGEETLLAFDLRRLGWQNVYIDDVVAHHHPEPRRDHSARDRRQTRNALWTAWMRLPVRDVARETLEVLGRVPTSRDARRGLWEAVAGLPSALRERHVVSDGVAEQWRLARQ